jgi:hypothetical protein
MAENELQARLTLQLGQTLSGMKTLAAEMRTVKGSVAELSTLTNRLQQESARTTRQQVEGAQKAGKETKTYNQLVDAQVAKLAEAHRRTRALEDAKKRLSAIDARPPPPTNPVAVPTTADFQAIDAAHWRTVRAGQATVEASTKGKTGLALLHQGWVRIAAGAAIAARTIGSVAAKYDEIQDRAQASFRASGGAALTMGQAFAVTDVLPSQANALTEEALRMQGPFTQDDLTAFVGQVARRAPDTNADRWRALMQTFAATATVPGAGQTLAQLAAIAPGASAGQLDRMTRAYTRASGGRPMDDGAARTVHSLAGSGFMGAPEALSLVASLSAYDRGGEAQELAAALRQPTASGDPVADTAAMAAWQQRVGYLRDQPFASRHAIAAVAPGLEQELRDGSLGRRVNASLGDLQFAGSGRDFAGSGTRADYEVDELGRRRALEIDGVTRIEDLEEARAEARRKAAVELRKNAAARGDGERGTTDFFADAASSVGLGRAYNAYDRSLGNRAPDAPAPPRVMQVEVVNDRTIRPQTY